MQKRTNKGKPTYRRRVMHSGGYESILIKWQQGAMTPVHGHGNARGITLVRKGMIAVWHHDPVTLDLLGITYHGPGEIILEDASDVHAVLAFRGPATTLHFWNRPLKMKVYSEEDLAAAGGRS